MGKRSGIHKDAFKEEKFSFDSKRGGASEKIAEQLKEIPFTSLYSSSLGRAKKTAQEIQKGREIPIEIMDEFIEISMGELEGKTKGDFLNYIRKNMRNTYRRI